MQTATDAPKTRQLTVEQVAVILQVAPDTVRNMAVRGTIPAHKIGRLWRFFESDFTRESREKQPA